MTMMISEYEKGYKNGKASARDDIIALIIGMQNGIMDKKDSERYQGMQDVLMEIINRFGDMFQEYKL